jgi:hypothetical protein
MDEPRVLTPEVGPEPAEREVPSPGAAIAGVFTRPRATFEGMRPKPHFKLALAILLLAQLVLTVALFQSGAVMNDAVAKMEAEGRSEEQIRTMEEFFQTPMMLGFTAVGGTISFAFVVLVMAGLMFFMGNLMQGAKLTYTHYLSVAVHGYLIGLVDQVVRAAIAFQKGTLSIPLGIGLLLPEDMGPLGKLLDTMTDPLVLWSTAILVLGVSVYARRGLRFGIVTVLPGFLLALGLSTLR